MILKKLSLSNFRNFTKNNFNFSPGINLIIGQNASGKTNLLEVIYLLSSGHSFRGGKDEEMINYQKELASVKGETLEESLEIVLTKGEVSGIRSPRKRYLINSTPKRAMDFVGFLQSIIFRPEDLEIIIDSPSIRRAYLDSVLERVNHQYRRASLSYKKGLRQRNKLLEQIREGESPRSSLFFWNKLLIENGQVITQKRKEFIDFVNNQSDHFINLEIKYDKSVISPTRLEKYKKEEVLAAKTLVGPHRDDFIINAQATKKNPTRNLSSFGSRGEQRLAIFSLKLAELEFVSLKTNQRPILLLDDIFSELDEANRNRLMEVIPQQQTIISATEIEMVDQKLRGKIKKIQL